MGGAGVHKIFYREQTVSISTVATQGCTGNAKVVDRAATKVD